MQQYILLIGLPDEGGLLKKIRCSLCSASSCTDTAQLKVPITDSVPSIDDGFQELKKQPDRYSAVLYAPQEAAQEQILAHVRRLSTALPRTPLLIVLEADVGLTSSDFAACGADEVLSFTSPEFLNQLRERIEFSQSRKRWSLSQTEVLQNSLDKLNTQAELLLHTAHEIKTPLTAIQGYAQALAEQLPSAELEELYLQPILSGSQHLLRLTNDLLDWHRSETGSLQLNVEETNLEDVFFELEQTFARQAADKGLSFQVLRASSLPTRLHSDPTRLKQILFNLVGNAIKFTSQGGVHILASYDRRHERLLVDVIDTGIGISRAHQSRLFQPFDKAYAESGKHYGGMGIGLSISQRLADLLGGSISCTSTPGHGSTFRLTIHAHIIDGASKTAPSEQQGLSLLPKGRKYCGHLVLVEDSPDISRLVSSYCTKRGLAVTCLGGGLQAASRTAALKPQIVLMDVRLPGVSGVQTMKELRSLGYKGAIVSFSASAPDQLDQAQGENGWSDHLPKPFTLPQLERVLSKYLPYSDSEEPAVETSTEDEELLQLIRDFVHGLPSRTAELEDAARSRNYPQLSLLAHRLKSAHVFGYPKIGDLAGTIEEAANKAQKDTLETAIAALSHQVDEILTSYSSSVH